MWRDDEVQVAARGGGELLLQGVRIPHDTAVVTPAIETAIRSGRYERREAAELPHILRPGDRVLEIGAGIGFISTLIARLPQVASVVAVEANPALIPFIREVHRRNGVEGVRVLNGVLSDAAKDAAPFYLREDFWMSSLSPAPNAYARKVEVPTIPFSDLLRRERITLVVCDVEGAETELFESADLSGVDRIYLEVHDHLTGLKGVRAVFEALHDKGFGFDPRHSSRSVVLFTRIGENETLRPYCG